MLELVTHIRQLLEVLLRALVLRRILLRELLVQGLGNVREMLMIRLNRVTKFVHALVLQRVLCRQTAVHTVANVSEMLPILLRCGTQLGNLLILRGILRSKLLVESFAQVKPLQALELIEGGAADTWRQRWLHGSAREGGAVMGGRGEVMQPVLVVKWMMINDLVRPDDDDGEWDSALGAEAS